MSVSSTYTVTAARAVDGDTVSAMLIKDEPLGFGLRHTVYSGDHIGPRVASVRLVTLDTPERTDRPNWQLAKDQAAAWLLARTGNLSVEVYGSGGLGRLLGDVYRTDDRTDTLTQHMLLLGWPVWEDR